MSGMGIDLVHYDYVVSVIRIAVAGNSSVTTVEFQGVTYDRHSNGGGWVARTATVSPSARLDPTVVVCDNAHVDDNAYIKGEVVVIGDSYVGPGCTWRRGHYIIGTASDKNGRTVYAAKGVVVRWKNPWRLSL